MVTQLIINGIELPEASGDRYQCYPFELSESIQMISGRIVKEVIGIIQKISYTYDYLPSADLRPILSALRSGNSLTVTYLPDNADEYQTSTFLVESITNPTFAFSKEGVGLWHNFSFTLREVSPHA